MGGIQVLDISLFGGGYGHIPPMRKLINMLFCNNNVFKDNFFPSYNVAVKQWLIINNTKFNFQEVLPTVWADKIFALT